jgi:ABC-2 type transport system permease protein
MAVYKRSYKGYSGEITSEWSRFLVLPRYAWGGLFQHRFLTIFFVLCFFYPLGCAIAIYLNSNIAFLSQYIRVPEGGLLEISGKFFFTYTGVQCTLAFLLTAFIGPGLVSSDLANHALPLYFCRPLSRTEYVVGKMSVIAILLSLITWVPGLLLFAMQASVGTSGWMNDHLWIVWALVAGCGIWILVISVLALALSAWVRWKIVAGAMMLVVFFLGSALAAACRAILRTTSGYWFDIASNIGRVWLHLFRVKDSTQDFTVEEATLSLLLISAFCVYLLARKVRAYEVVR